MPITIYGIKNCDTMKKAWSWLDAHKVPYVFHDYRVSGIDKAHLEAWCRELGWEKVLNKGSTTFRELPEAVDRGSFLPASTPSLLFAPAEDFFLGEHGELFCGQVEAGRDRCHPDLDPPRRGPARDRTGIRRDACLDAVLVEQCL